MTAFLFLAAAMALVALAFVVLPFVRVASDRRWGTLIAAFIAVPVLAAGLYFSLSDWNWEAPPPEAATQNAVPPMVLKMVAGLEEKMKQDPSNLDGWLRLGLSYFQLGDYAKSVNAYQRAYTLTRGSNAEAALGLGEAMTFQDESTLMGSAAELFEQGYELDAKHPKALWYTGLIAYQRQNWDLAHERWSAMAALDMPPEVRQVLLSRLAEIESKRAAPRTPAAGSSR
jgi:cytochrome c-type biogenesis protein CcmH